MQLAAASGAAAAPASTRIHVGVRGGQCASAGYTPPLAFQSPPKAPPTAVIPGAEPAEPVMPVNWTGSGSASRCSSPRSPTYDAFGVFRTTFRELDRKTPIFL